MKKKSRIEYIPSPQYPLVIPDADDILLDIDFDDTEELILFEPPIMATRRCGGHMHRLDKDEEDDD